jgi:hypothetical protein
MTGVLNQMRMFVNSTTRVHAAHARHALADFSMVRKKEIGGRNRVSAWEPELW